MNLKKSPFAIQDKNERDLDNAKDYPTIADLMQEQKVSIEDKNTVHHRRDLDSLGQYLDAYLVMIFKKHYYQSLIKKERKQIILREFIKEDLQLKSSLIKIPMIIFERQFIIKIY